MGFFQKMLLLYLMFAIAFAIAAPSTVFGGTAAGRTALQFFNLETYNQTSGDIIIPEQGTTLSDDWQNATQTGKGLFSTGTGTTNNFFSIIIDPLSNLMNIITVVFSIVLSPVLLLTSPAMNGAPTAIYLLIGLPLVLLFIGTITLLVGGRVDSN